MKKIISLLVVVSSSLSFSKQLSKYILPNDYLSLNSQTKTVIDDINTDVDALKNITEKLAQKAILKFRVQTPEHFHYEVLLNENYVIDIKKIETSDKIFFVPINLAMYTCSIPSEEKALAEEILYTTNQLDPKFSHKLFKKYNTRNIEKVKACITKFTETECLMGIKKLQSSNIKTTKYQYSLDPKTCDSVYVVENVKLNLESGTSDSLMLGSTKFYEELNLPEIKSSDVSKKLMKEIGKVKKAKAL